MGKCLLSRSTCKVLGIIEQSDGGGVRGHGGGVEFRKPSGGSYGSPSQPLPTHSMVQQAGGYQPVGECDPDSVLPCQCPRREFVDLPKSCPIEMKMENWAELEAWFFKHYVGRAFCAAALEGAGEEGY